MRVIICGGGQVGYSIAAYLAREDNDVTVIDSNPHVAAQVNGELDVNGICGHASNPDVLSKAGAKDADLLIAVTQTDEVNMMACQVAHSLFNIPKRIARIREQAYLDPAWSNLFTRDHMPIDVIISPEIEVARATLQRLNVPGTTNVISLADDLIYLVGVICSGNCPILGTEFKEIATVFPGLSITIGTIQRGSQVIIPGGSDRIQAGDEVYFFADSRHIERALQIFGHEEKLAHNIIILGGGNVGLYLAKLLQSELADANIKIIESNAERARYLSENLNGVLVLNGDGLHKNILEEANIKQAETMIAVTNSDEINILGALLAKQHGCQRVISLVNNSDYAPLTAPMGIDAVVSPRASTVSKIMQHVRRGRIKALHTLRDGMAEVIEAEVSANCSIANQEIGNIVFPAGVRLAALVRDKKVIPITKEEMILPDDHVIVISTGNQARTVEKMFTVQVDLF